MRKKLSNVETEEWSRRSDECLKREKDAANKRLHRFQMILPTFDPEEKDFS